MAKSKPIGKSVDATVGDLRSSPINVVHELRTPNPEAVSEGLLPSALPISRILEGDAFDGEAHVRWSDSDSLTVQIGTKDLRLLITVDGEHERELVLEQGPSNSLYVNGMSGGAGPGVHPHIKGSGGRLLSIELVAGEMATGTPDPDRVNPRQIVLRPNLVLALGTRFLRIAGLIVHFEELPELSLFDNGGTFAMPAGSTTVLSGAQLFLPRNAAGIDELTVEQDSGGGSSGLVAPLNRVILTPYAEFIVGAKQYLREARLAPTSRLVLEAGASAGHIEGANGRVADRFWQSGQPVRTPGTIVPLMTHWPLEESERRAVTVNRAIGVNIEMSGQHEFDEVPEASRLEIKAELRDASIYFRTSRHAEVAPDLVLSEGAVASNVNFAAPSVAGPDRADHHHIALKMEPYSVLVNATGSTSLARAAKATIRGDSLQGLELCSAEPAAMDGAQIEAVLVPIGSRRSLSVAQAADSADVFEPHPLTWSHDGGVFGSARSCGDPASLAKRVVSAAAAIRAPAEHAESTERAALLALERATNANSTQALTRAGVRYAALSYRQLHATGRSERIILLAGRILGFGLRIARPTLLWLSMSVFIATWLALGSNAPIDLSLAGVGRFAGAVGNVAVEPSGLVRGVANKSALAEANLEPWSAFSLRVLLALPLGSALLAVARRATWSRG